MINTATIFEAISKYGFATVIATLALFYYRIDVVLPNRAQSEKLILVNEKHADTQASQTEILKGMADGIEQIKIDQKKFPAVSGNP